MEMVEIGASKKDKALRNAQEQAAKVRARCVREACFGHMKAKA
jgi:hypothetical protein